MELIQIEWHNVEYKKAKSTERLEMERVIEKENARKQKWRSDDDKSRKKNYLTKKKSDAQAIVSINLSLFFSKINDDC